MAVDPLSKLDTLYHPQNPFVLSAAPNLDPGYEPITTSPRPIPPPRPNPFSPRVLEFPGRPGIPSPEVPPENVPGIGAGPLGLTAVIIGTIIYTVEADKAEEEKKRGEEIRKAVEPDRQIIYTSSHWVKYIIGPEGEKEKVGESHIANPLADPTPRVLPVPGQILNSAEESKPEPAPETYTTSDIGTAKMEGAHGEENVRVVATAGENLPGGITAISVLADGEGEFASQMSREAVFEFLTTVISLVHFRGIEELPDILKEAVKAVEDNATKIDRASWASLVAAVHVENTVYIVSLGDNRAYHIIDRGSVNRLGKEFDDSLHIFKIEVKPGETILLTSQGVHHTLKIANETATNRLLGTYALNGSPAEASKGILDAVRKKAREDQESAGVVVMKIVAKGVSVTPETKPEDPPFADLDLSDISGVSAINQIQMAVCVFAIIERECAHLYEKIRALKEGQVKEWKELVALYQGRVDELMKIWHANGIKPALIPAFRDIFTALHHEPFTALIFYRAISMVERGEINWDQAQLMVTDPLAPMKGHLPGSGIHYQVPLSRAELMGAMMNYLGSNFIPQETPEGIIFWRVQEDTLGEGFHFHPVAPLQPDELVFKAYQIILNLKVSEVADGGRTGLLVSRSEIETPSFTPNQHPQFEPVMVRLMRGDKEVPVVIERLSYEEAWPLLDGELLKELETDVGLFPLRNPNLIIIVARSLDGTVQAIAVRHLQTDADGQKYVACDRIIKSDRTKETAFKWIGLAMNAALIRAMKQNGEWGLEDDTLMLRDIRSDVLDRFRSRFPSPVKPYNPSDPLSQPVYGISVKEGDYILSLFTSTSTLFSMRPLP